MDRDGSNGGGGGGSGGGGGGGGGDMSDCDCIVLGPLDLDDKTGIDDKRARCSAGHGPAGGGVTGHSDKFIGMLAEKCEKCRDQALRQRYVASVHIPAPKTLEERGSTQAEQAAQLIAQIRHSREREDVIVMGDFNLERSTGTMKGIVSCTPGMHYMSRNLKTGPVHKIDHVIGTIGGPARKVPPCPRALRPTRGENAQARAVRAGAASACRHAEMGYSAPERGASGDGVLVLAKQVLIPQMLYQISFFSFLPAFVALIIARACDDVRGATGDVMLDCTDTSVAKKSALWYNLLLGALNVPSLMSCVAVGALSDRRGRRGPLLFTVLCVAVSAGAMWACSALDFDIFLLLPFLLFGGLGGGLAAFIALCFGAAADVSRGDGRELPRNFAWVTSGLFFGGTVAPLMGGLVTRRFSVSATLASAAVLFCLTALYYGTVFQESLAPAVRLKAPLRLSSIVCDTMRIVLDRRRRRLRLLFVCYNLLYLTIAGQYNLIIVYVSSEPFKFGADTVGYLIALNWLMRSAMLFVVPRLIGPLSFGRGATHGQLNMVRLGSAFTVCSFVGYGFARSAHAVFALTAFDGVCIMWNSAIRTLFSGEVSESEQGTILSVIGLTETFWNLMTPFVFNSIFAATLDSVR
eukprot:g6507.t1